MIPKEDHMETASPNGDRPSDPDTGKRPRTAESGAEERRRNPVSRLAGESRALFDDLREWVDLRVQLVQVDIEERIEKAANEVIAIIMVVVLGLFALLFLLHGLAIWLGEILGGLHWGYLIVAGVLGLTTMALRTVKPDFMSRRQASSAEDKEALPEYRPPKAILPESTDTDAEADEEKMEGEAHV